MSRATSNLSVSHVRIVQCVGVYLYAVSLLFVSVAVLDAQFAGNQSSPQQTLDAVSLLDFSQKNNIAVYWDVLHNSGMLVKGATVVTFNTQLSFALVNFQRLHTIDRIEQRNEQFFISSRTETVLESIFAPEIENESSSLLLATIESEQEEVPYRAPQTTNQFFGSRIAVVFIDAGHGGKDPGAIGRITYNQKKYEVHEIKYCI